MWEPSLAGHALLESILPLRIGYPVHFVPQDNIRTTPGRLRARLALLESTVPRQARVRVQIVPQESTTPRQEAVQQVSARIVLLVNILVGELALVHLAQPEKEQKVRALHQLHTVAIARQCTVEQEARLLPQQMLPSPLAALRSVATKTGTNTNYQQSRRTITATIAGHRQSSSGGHHVDRVIMGIRTRRHTVHLA